MTHSVLPDQEKRHLLQFHLFPAMEYRMRLAIAFLLIIVGLLAQLTLTPDAHYPLWALTLLAILGGNSLLLARGYDLRPTTLEGDVRWERTTEAQFQKARELARSVRRWDESITDISCVTGFLTLAALVALCGFIVMGLLTLPDGERWAITFGADAAALLLPHWLTGLRRGWRPVSLEQQTKAVESALAAVSRYSEPTCQVQRMFGLSGSDDQSVPVGARAFLSFPDGPKNFLGLQFQVSINDVNGTKYPYLYAVLVARHGLNMRRSPALREAEQLAGRRLTVESNHEKEVDVIVIRRRTTKKSGYHTQPKHIKEIVEVAWRTTQSIIDSANDGA